jgi:predicted O-methyltransferase YrrM
MPARPAAPAETLLAPAVEAYLERLLPPRDPVLQAMERLARREHIPIVGPACGRLLALLVHLSGARRIFEMGSAIGYSTLWLARAAGPRGCVFYTDSDPARAQRARQFFERAGVLPRVRLLIGDALDCLARTPGSFDLIFVDVDKEQYPAALRLALPRLRPGGLLVADNALWHGRAALPRQMGDAATRAVQEYNRTVFSDPGLFSVLVPLRDGMVVSWKIPAGARR